MNRIKYRICILIVLVIAVAFGIWFYTNNAAKEKEPFAGATFVQAEEAGTKAIQAVVRLEEPHLRDNS